MPLIVQKYGGSSLATTAHIRRAAVRIEALKAAGNDVVVVVSAMGRMTDHLIRLAHRLVEHPEQRELDMLMTAGERVSMSLLAMSLHDLGIRAISFTGSQSGIVTTSDHTDAKIIDIRATRIRDELGKGKVVIVAGFQGISLEKEITTLGRGGSDTTAVALAAVLGAQRCEILTDVDGLFTADPRVVSSAKLIPSCSYDVGLELASLGAKMHSRSIALAKRFGVKVWIASSHPQSVTGTQVSEGEIMEDTLVRGISSRDGYYFFSAVVPIGQLLEGLKSKKIPLRFFQVSENKVSFLCEKEKAALVREVIASLVSDYEEIGKVSVVSAVGEGIGHAGHLLAEMWQTIQQSTTRCLLMTSNSLSVSAAVPSDAVAKVVPQLHAQWIGLAQKKEPPREGALHVGGETL